MTDAQLDAQLGQILRGTTQLPTNLEKGSSGAVCSEVFYGNWQELIIGQWGGLEFMASGETGDAFEKCQTWIRVIQECDIKTRVIVACTSAEYGTTTELQRPLKETDPLLAVHPYGISKIATELLSRQYYLNFGIEIVNLRFFNQTGPRKKGDACADFISKTAKIDLGLSEPIIEVGNLNPYRDFTDIKDSVQAIWLSAKKGKSGETYNVCSSRKMQIREILDIALKLSKKRIKVIENTPSKLRATDEDVILGDNSKITEDLGWKISRSIEETLRDMFDYWIEYYKNHPE